MKPEIFFLLGFGEHHGYGHLARCSNLAKSLKKLGFKVNLILTNKYIKIQQENFSDGFLNVFNKNVNFLFNPNMEDTNQSQLRSHFINQIVDQNILIIDDYYLNKDILKNVVNAKSIIQFKDDIYDIDLVNIKDKKNKIIYFLPESLIPKNLKNYKNIFYGLDLFPLFPPSLEIIYPKLFIQNKINIFFAPGSGFCDLTNKLFDVISNLSEYENLNFYTPNSNLSKRNDTKNIIPIDGNNGIANYLYYANLVISAAGNTMLETLKLNTPMIIFCTNKNQNLLANYISRTTNVDYINNTKMINYDTIINFSSKAKTRVDQIVNFSNSHDKVLELIFQN